MSWLWDSSSSTAPIEAQTINEDASSSTSETPEAPTFDSRPVFALDQIKNAGVPIQMQMSPYLQMDPSIFRQSAPQYIMPDGGNTGKGKFEFALGHIGWAVGGGYAVGAVRGFIPEFFNPDTRQLRGKPWMTRMMNATVKHGSGYAQPAGAAVFLFSALEILLRKLRPDDDFNSIAAGGMAGALYRSAYGLRASAIGAAAGLVLATCWVFGNADSRQRMRDMLNYG
uniref:Mitochondrial import inner membrane translocase subunit TIM23 n=2 Tax=Ascaris TaxID=6251 RepID=A0A9J2P199_ASCLU